MRCIPLGGEFGTSPFLAGGVFVIILDPVVEVEKFGHRHFGFLGKGRVSPAYPATHAHTRTYTRTHTLSPFLFFVREAPFSFGEAAHSNVKCLSR